MVDNEPVNLGLWDTVIILIILNSYINPYFCFFLGWSRRYIQMNKIKKFIIKF
jgi:hypothetical protein